MKIPTYQETAPRLIQQPKPTGEEGVIVGKAVAGLGGVISEVGRDAAQKVQQARIDNELMNAKLAATKARNDEMFLLEADKDYDTHEERYTQFDQKLLGQLGGTFKEPKASEQFSVWFNFTGEENRVKVRGRAWGLEVEDIRANADQRLKQYAESGFHALIDEEINNLLTNGVVEPGDAKKASDHYHHLADYNLTRNAALATLGREGLEAANAFIYSNDVPETLDAKDKQALHDDIVNEYNLGKSLQKQRHQEQRDGEFKSAVQMFSNTAYGFEGPKLTRKILLDGTVPGGQFDDLEGEDIDRIMGMFDQLEKASEGDQDKWQEYIDPSFYIRYAVMLADPTVSNVEMNAFLRTGLDTDKSGQPKLGPKKFTQLLGEIETRKNDPVLQEGLADIKKRFDSLEVEYAEQPAVVATINEIQSRAMEAYILFCKTNDDPKARADRLSQITTPKVRGLIGQFLQRHNIDLRASMANAMGLGGKGEKTAQMEAGVTQLEAEVGIAPGGVSGQAAGTTNKTYASSIMDAYQKQTGKPPAVDEEWVTSSLDEFNKVYGSPVDVAFDKDGRPLYFNGTSWYQKTGKNRKSWKVYNKEMNRWNETTMK